MYATINVSIKLLKHWFSYHMCLRLTQNVIRNLKPHFEKIADVQRQFTITLNVVNYFNCYVYFSNYWISLSSQSSPFVQRHSQKG